MGACVAQRRTPDPDRRPRRPVQRDGRARAAQGLDALLVRLPDAARSRSPRPPARRARTTSGSFPPMWIWPAPPWSCRAPTATRPACATASARSASASPTRCSTARPRSGPVAVNALVAADKVIVPVQAEYLALEGLVQFLDTLKLVRRELNPDPGDGGRADHDARRPHPPLPGRRARAARAPAGAGLQDRRPAQRPGRRGARATASRSPSTIRSPRARGPTARSPTRSSPSEPSMAERKRGMGRGLAAILPESSRGRARAARARRHPDRAQPRPAARQVRRRRPRRPGGLDRLGRAAAAADRPAARRRPLRAGRGRAPLARRPEGRASTGSRP